MNPEQMAQLIVQKGIKNINLNMFSEQDKRAILTEVAQIYIRQGKTDEVMDILEHVDANRFLDILKKTAEESFQLGEYEKAAKLYERIGDKQFSDYIKDNFLKN
jgi:hypothetical protein